MIYVWDNGEEYSDHSIYFVDGGNYPDDFVRLVLGMESGYLVLTAPQVTWWKGGAMALVEWFNPWNIIGGRLDVIDDPDYRALLAYPDQSVVEGYLRAVCDRLLGEYRTSMEAELSRRFGAPASQHADGADPHTNLCVRT